MLNVSERLISLGYHRPNLFRRKLGSVSFDGAEKID